MISAQALPGFDLGRSPPSAADSEPEPVEATVGHVHVQKEESGWTSMTVDHAGMPEGWVGIMPSVAEGMRVRATGVWEESDRFGRQFRVQSLIVLMPDAADPDALARFLGKLVKGIGERLAWRIVDTLGAEILPALETPSPEKIAEVRGVSLEKATELCVEWNKHSVEGRLIVALARYGLRGHVAKKIIKRYGGRAMEVCEKEPYLLCIEVEGVGWKTADKIAKAVGVPLDSVTRMEAGILHTFDEKVASRGHCFADRGELLAKAGELLDLGVDKLADGLTALQNRGRMTLEGARVFPTGLLRAEVRVAERVARLLRAPALLRRWQADPMDPLSTGIPEQEVPPEPDLLALAEQAIASFERRAGAPLAQFQRDAVRAAMKYKLVIITGGPGVGKSHLTRAIIDAWATAGFTISLGAPTGRAAKRLAEATGRPASTIHRLLEFDPRESRFTRDATRPLEQTAICLDELSMCDLPLLASFLEGVDDGSRVVLVGDVDQLPSVGPGAVLRDLIDSGVIHVVRLTQIFRQAEGSRIITNAHRVNRGEMPEEPAGDSDFYWIRRTDAEQSLATTMKVILERLSKRNISTKDAIVISPQKRGICGVGNLNRRLQEALNPAGPAITLGRAPDQTIYRVGDRVLQMKNDYERTVFNGELGWVISLDSEKPSMVVRFGDGVEARDVVYERKHFEHVQHAYSVTCHRMQGSQAKAVIVILLREHFNMLSRQLLYTAMTRGEKLVVLIADPAAVRTALSETRREMRNTGLRERLIAACATR